MSDLLVSLLIWIGSQLNLAVDVDTVPGVRFAPADTLVRMAFGGTRPTAARPKKILGLYDFENQIIYLADGLDLDSNEGKAILVHELVHFLQYQHGVDQRSACVSDLEPAAYLLENIYRNRHAMTATPVLKAAHRSGC